MGWVLDLDGVMWLGADPVPGSADAANRLLEAGEEVVFITNNSAVTVGAVEEKLRAAGVEATGRILTSAMAGASLVAPGERVVVCAGPGVVEALEARGAVVVHGPEADVVVVGLARELTYDLLSRATLAVRGGARLVATNDDATYPTSEGQLPGGGAILAAVVTATGAMPEIAGKPHEAMATLARERAGTEGIVVGDRPETDGAFAERLGHRFGLVLSGVTTAQDLPVIPEPDLVADDLASLVAEHRGRS